jgi:hypothetical protein
LLRRGLLRTSREDRSVVGFKIHTVLQALAGNAIGLLRAPRPLRTDGILTCALRADRSRSGTSENDASERHVRQSPSHVFPPRFSGIGNSEIVARVALPFSAPPFQPSVSATESQVDELCSVVQQMFAVRVAMMGTSQRNHEKAPGWR